MVVIISSSNRKCTVSTAHAKTKSVQMVHSSVLRKFLYYTKSKVSKTFCNKHIAPDFKPDPSSPPFMKDPKS